MALAFPLAAWMFGSFLETRTTKSALLAGLAAGIALTVKYTAIILLPTFVVLWAVWHWRHRDAKTQRPWRGYLIVAAAAWGFVLLLYFPNWSPAPPVDARTAALLRVPDWFLSFRSLLIPREYFKGLAITLMHALGGHDSYLNGQWSHNGWWYYFPVALAMKSPLPFLLFAVAGLALALKRWRELSFAELIVWLSAAVYFSCAMRSKANLGLRHVLTVFPLICVGASVAITCWLRTTKLPRNAVALFPAWSLIVAVITYPLYISYFNELAGGPDNGYLHLVDSNFDWGQDGIRLKRYLDTQGIKGIYLDYYGTQAAIEYYKIPNRRVNGEVAKQIKNGYLVVSTSQLMRHEWDWLRDSRQPVARVAYTLFVYQFP